MVCGILITYDVPLPTPKDNLVTLKDTEENNNSSVNTQISRGLGVFYNL